MIPEHLKHLPVDRRGLPVPWIAAWSSEHWAVARFDPLVDRHALFTAGRYGRGIPAFDVMNEPRQREAVRRGLCQVCKTELPKEGARPMGYLPASVLEHGVQRFDNDLPVTAEPLCCLPCAEYVTVHCCVLKRRDPAIVEVTNWMPLAQIINPGAAPPTHANRFDHDVDTERLTKLARLYGGLVGLVKVIVVETKPV